MNRTLNWREKILENLEPNRTWRTEGFSPATLTQKYYVHDVQMAPDTDCVRFRLFAVRLGQCAMTVRDDSAR